MARDEDMLAMVSGAIDGGVELDMGQGGAVEKTGPRDFETDAEDVWGSITDGHGSGSAETQAQIHDEFKDEMMRRGHEERQIDDWLANADEGSVARPPE